MSLTSKLVNPTPFNVEYKYEKGIVLKIPSDGELELTIGQLDDFRPGQAGSEEVRKILDYHGLFLKDGDKSYDSQALASLEASLKAKKTHLDEVIHSLRSAHSAQGNPISDDGLEEKLRLSGHGRFVGEIEKLQERIKILKDVVRKDPTKGRIKEDLDPERTTFVTEPPRQFASRTALQMFLNENPELKEKHEKLYKEMVGANA